MADQVVLSWSGGKDSSLALAALQVDSRYEVVATCPTLLSAICTSPMSGSIASGFFNRLASLPFFRPFRLLRSHTGFSNQSLVMMNKGAPSNS